MFAGLRSRWITPCAWATMTPWHTSAMIRAASRTGERRALPFIAFGDARLLERDPILRPVVRDFVAEFHGQVAPPVQRSTDIKDGDDESAGHRVGRLGLAVNLVEVTLGVELSEETA
jgi:hypothetical protein